MRSTSFLHFVHIGKVILLLCIILSCIGCSKPSTIHTSVAIDWVDFIKFNGIRYLAVSDTSTIKGASFTQSDLGPVFGKVKHKLEVTVHDPNYQAQDGDAARLDVGTSVYSIKGYRSNFRLAIIQHGQVIVYQADDNPAARTGGDVLDIQGIFPLCSY
jgi:hypothetical protein